MSVSRRVERSSSFSSSSSKTEESDETSVTPPTIIPRGRKLPPVDLPQPPAPSESGTGTLANEGTGRTRPTLEKRQSLLKRTTRTTSLAAPRGAVRTGVRVDCSQSTLTPIGTTPRREAATVCIKRSPLADFAMDSPAAPLTHRDAVRPQPAAALPRTGPTLQPLPLPVAPLPLPALPPSSTASTTTANYTVDFFTVLREDPEAIRDACKPLALASPRTDLGGRKVLQFEKRVLCGTRQEIEDAVTGLHSAALAQFGRTLPRRKTGKFDQWLKEQLAKLDVDTLQGLLSPPSYVNGLDLKDTIKEPAKQKKAQAVLDTEQYFLEMIAERAKKELVLRLGPAAVTPRSSGGPALSNSDAGLVATERRTGEDETEPSDTESVATESTEASSSETEPSESQEKSEG